MTKAKKMSIRRDDKTQDGTRQDKTRQSETTTATATNTIPRARHHQVGKESEREGKRQKLNIFKTEQKYVRYIY
jgi:hypothetical protein